MALYPNPQSELMREPNLLIPGKKPVGNVKIDSSNPLARGCSLLHLYNYTAFDISGFGNDGTLASGTTFVTADNAVCLDCDGPGSGDVIAIPPVPTLCGGSLTSFSWTFRVKADTVTTRAGIWQNGLSTGVDGFLIWLEGTTEVRFTVSNWSASYASASLTATNWNWITGTYNILTGKINLYVNGEVGTEATNLTESTYSGSFLMAGFYPLFERELDGQISCSMFHARELSSGDVLELHRDPYQFLIPA